MPPADLRKPAARWIPGRGAHEALGVATTRAAAGRNHPPMVVFVMLAALILLSALAGQPLVPKDGWYP